MSSKRMPGEGKSGNWRSEFLSLNVRLASSAAAAGPAVESSPWAAAWLVAPPVVLPVSVGSGVPWGGWLAVLSLWWWAGAGCSAELVLAGVEVVSGWRPDMVKRKRREVIRGLEGEVRAGYVRAARREKLGCGLTV